MSDSATTPRSAPLLFGRYRVHAHLGDTRLSSVYAAADERLQRRVLLHLLRKDLGENPRAHERFGAEAGQMAQRAHPALLEVFDRGEVSGRPFVVSEYLSGRPLRDLGVLSVEQALLYLRQVAGAVASCQSRRSAAWPQGVSYPPISSSNVLVVAEGQVKLVESWLPGGPEWLVDQAHYRAPELSQGQPASAATAVYALGLLLFEALSGERPMQGADARAVALAHLHTTIPALSQVRPGLYLPSVERLIAKATARVPEYRHAEAQALVHDLDALWHELNASTQPLRSQRPRPAPAHDPAPQSSGPQPTPPPSGPQAPPQPISRPQPQRPQVGAAQGPALPRPGQAAADPGMLRRQRRSHHLMGWFVMLSLLLLVAAGSFVAVRTIANLDRPAVSLPGMPQLPDFGVERPLDWLISLIQPADEIYVVNIAEGLNLRREPDANDPANILAIVPNGTPVRKLEGPRIADNIPWLRVRAEVDGRTVEGWMSLNYLLPQ